jgi:modulator of FtsH protease
MQEIYNASENQAELSQPEVAKVLRNTYMLLAMTLTFSAVTCGISMAVGLGRGTALIMSLASLALIWFVLPRTANSSKGILVVFAFTGLLGASLGPTLNHYLAMSNGSQIVLQALGGTALVFFALSGYVLTTKKDFSFLGGFLFVGLIIAIVAMLGLAIASYFGVHISGAFLAINAAIVFIMSGFILFDTSRIINGGETNYIMATTALYLDIYNLFTSLLHLIGAMSDD